MRLVANPAVIALILLTLWMVVTTVFAIYPDESWADLKRTFKIQAMTLMAIAALRERRHIELFIWVNALSLGFYGFKGGLFTILTGGAQRVWGPPGGFIEGNNEVGPRAGDGHPDDELPAGGQHAPLAAPRPWRR